MENTKKLRNLTENLHILYAEDEDMLREDTIEIFENFFKEVDGAIDGKDGLEKYLKFYKDNGYYYDIVFTDINMPNMDGHQLIEEIHKINPEQVISVISAYNETSRFIKLIEQGIESFILKPMKNENLLQVLYKLSKTVVNNKLAIEYTANMKKINIQLESYNKTLNQQVHKQVEEIRQKDTMLFHQAKLAAMGEMMDAVAHQWKQPLSVISTYVTSLKFQNDSGKLSSDSIEKIEIKTMEQIDHLVETIDEFRSFFRTNIKKQQVDIEDEIKNIFMLMHDTLIKNDIKTQLNIDKQLMANIVPTEFKHILINLINNSKDAFIENNIKNRDIIFNISQDNTGYLVKIQDNAGGIPKDIIDNIFNVNFTTKGEGKGTGMGLYMSKMIIEKIEGEISVKNSEDGVCFTILIPN